MNSLIKLLMYGSAVGGIILYFFLQRRRSHATYRRTFNEKSMLLHDLISQETEHNREEQVAVVTYFLECYWLFEGILLSDYLDELYPDIAQSASPWEVRALQLRELQAEQGITHLQIDLLLAMKQYVLYAETARWPGVLYQEDEFFNDSLQKIRIYSQTMRELATHTELE